MPNRLRLIALASALLASAALAQEAPKAKFGPEALPLSQATDYLRQSEAPDYWNLSQFYVPQRGTSDCSLAAILMTVNGLRGVPANAEDQLVTDNALMGAVADQDWMVKVTEDGTGVTFEETLRYLRKSLDAFGLQDAAITSAQPKTDDASALAALREALAANEAGDGDVMLVYFNQGVITGDWDGPHISPIGAYDAANDRVLVMDVDRSWYVPYWTSTETLLASLVKPISAEHGVLAGGTGGYIIASRPSAGAVTPTD